MKQCYYFILATIAICITACTKDVPSVEDPQQNIPEEVTPNPEPKTITFGVTMDLGEEASSGAETKASLSGLNINWVGGETIFIANDINDDIQNCVLTKDPTYPTKGTITVSAVDGASTYYALFTSGTASTDGKVVFDHTTATFSGSEVICRYNELTASAPHRTDLAMAGKTVGDNIAMKPCLALVKFKVHANSVSAEYVDGSGYSSVRGFNLIMRLSGSRKYISGNYTVNLSGSDMVVSPAASGNRDQKQLSSATRLDSAKDYYFSVIPVGAINKMELVFLGFKWNAGSSSYDMTWGDDPKEYHMSLSQSLSIDPGDFFNFGTLNPVDLQKAKDTFVPAININGDMSDWTSITTGVSSSGHYKAFKVTYDEYNIYVYSKVDKVTGRFAWGGSTVYLYYGFDTDNNPDNAGSLIDSNVSHGKFESILLTYPFGGSDVSPEIRTNPNPTINGESVTISCAGANEDTMVETEMSISRTQLGITKGDVVRIQSLGNKDIGWLPEDVVITIAK
jgi:hypothetical protein